MTTPEDSPTDAEVEAALRKWCGPTEALWRPDAHADMRAALQAAAAARPATSSTDDEREDLAYLITAKRFHERGLRGAIGEPDIALARPLADFLIAEGFRRRGPITDAEDHAGHDAGHDAGHHAGHDRPTALVDLLAAHSWHQIGCACGWDNPVTFEEPNTAHDRAYAEHLAGVLAARDDAALDGYKEAWDALALHPYFRECYDAEAPLLDAMLAKLDRVHERIAQAQINRDVALAERDALIGSGDFVSRFTAILWPMWSETGSLDHLEPYVREIAEYDVREALAKVRAS